MEELLKVIIERLSVRLEFASPFKDFIKKNKEKILHKKIGNMTADICQNPYIGVKKKGILKDITTRKFYYNRTEYIIAFELIPPQNGVKIAIEFIMVGVHEGFYDRLENYIKYRYRGNT